MLFANIRTISKKQTPLFSKNIIALSARQKKTGKPDLRSIPAGKAHFLCKQKRQKPDLRFMPAGKAHFLCKQKRQKPDFLGFLSLSHLLSCPLERKTGFGPATPTLARWCSTTELFPQLCQKTSSSGKRGSNPRPRPWEGRALPTELFPPIRTALIHGAYRTANIACLIFSTKFFSASLPRAQFFPLFASGSTRPGMPPHAVRLLQKGNLPFPGTDRRCARPGEHRPPVRSTVRTRSDCH